MNALLSWMRLRKRGAGEGGGGPASSGYDRALDYLAEPAVRYNPKDGEFRFRLGSLVAPPPSAYLPSIVAASGGTSTTIDGGEDEAFLGSVASDLIGGTGRRGDDVRSGLSSIVDAAVKRHASSDVVPQVDGALAVLLLMVLRGRSDDDRPSSSSESKRVLLLPASASRTVIAGGTERGHKTSFLDSPSVPCICDGNASRLSREEHCQNLQ